MALQMYLNEVERSILIVCWTGEVDEVKKDDKD